MPRGVERQRHACHDGWPCRSRPATALTLLLALLLAATAQAQSTDPNATVEEQATTSQIDTDHTPVAKEFPEGQEMWTLFHGAPYPETEVVEGSVTSFDTDLFSVAFKNTTIGLAGGSACAIEPVQERGEDDREFGARASDCKGTDETIVPRVPALYRYAEPPNQDPSWDRIELPKPASPQNQDNAGYIGAIAWIDDKRALVVGGTGAYPRREPPPDGKAPTDPDKNDPAGTARAWVYTRATNETPESIAELDLSALTADEPNRAGMRGLTAAACFPNPKLEPGKTELCFVGGLGQIWEWREGAFNGKRIDAQSPATELQNASLFRYRVRDLSFSGLWPWAAYPNSSAPEVASAFTAGCCDPDETRNTPNTLAYKEVSAYPCDHWTLGTHKCHPGGPIWSASGAAQNSTAGVAPQGLSDPFAPKGPADPDSYYAPGLLSPGGPARPDEPPSSFAERGAFYGIAPWGATVTAAFSTARFHDRTASWVVGEHRATQRGDLGTRGLLYAASMGRVTANAAVNAQVDSSFPPSVYPTPEAVANGYDPILEERVAESLRSRYYYLPSYTANAVAVLAAGGDGWMVGERGAILRIGAAGKTASAGSLEPEPPRLGASRRRPLSDKSAYAETRPELPETAGVVPALGAETVQLDQPEMIPSGSPGVPMQHVVMSRDGSEAWAIGTAPGGGGPTFARFDGVAWSECDPLGIEGHAPPDPACEEMAPLRGYRDKNGNLRTASLKHVVRVPLETDPDPTNDDELEILAIGETYTGPETGGKQMTTVVRYADGRWSFDAEAAGVVDAGMVNGSGALQSGGIGDLAFTAPDDGWAIVNDRALYHFDGTRWIDCTAEPGECGDDGQVPRSASATDRSLTGLTVAGDRIYLYGRHSIGENCAASVVASYLCSGRLVPFILYHDPGGKWTDGSEEGGDDGGFDPAFSNPATTEAGKVSSLSVVEGAGGFEGWAVGEFGGTEVRAGGGSAARTPPEAVLMRLDPSTGEGWQRFNSPGSLEDYTLPKTLAARGGEAPGGPQVTYPTGGHPDGAFIASFNRVFGFDADRERFRMLDAGRAQGMIQNLQLFPAAPDGRVATMTPDGRGGFWAAVGGNSGGEVPTGNHFFHYTDTPPRELFEETANPLGTRNAKLRALTGGPDGSVWAATDSDRVFRYDRLTGWEEARIGWDPGRVVTRTSQAAAIAVGPGGEGLVVGEGGRIADLSPTGVVLDAASGRTGHDLEAVDVAADGSALAGGKGLSLLWRPAGGGFAEAVKPRIGASAEITAISIPTPSRAYLATDRGVIFRGDLSGESWSWRADNLDSAGEPISIGELNDIAVDSQGHGYAVADGVILERTGEGAWRRMARRYGGGTTVELPEVGGEGVLIGDEDGRILAGAGADLHVARHREFADGSSVLDFAYLPGSSEGSVDAWAGIGPRGAGDSRVLRFRSHPEDPQLDPAAATPPLPDAPAHEDGELSLAAFGKSDCDNPEDRLCPEMTATTTTNELILERIIDELAGLRGNGELDLALGSGDAADSAGMPASSLTDLDRVGGPGGVGGGLTLNHTQRAGQLKHSLYTELVANEFADRGVPHFAAIGSQDLSETVTCDTESCETTKQFANAGENLSWREAFSESAEPWGDGAGVLDSESEAEIQLEPAPGSEDNSLRIEDQRADADGEGTAPEAKAEIGGASTHYAIDASRDGETIARIVFVDTSLRSLAAADPLQQPHELAGGQTRFLERMICREGESTSFGDGCTRTESQRAIVVSNTPTYSYGPGALSHTALDATTFEALMLRHDVDLVISGALGYNGLYYTLAPGVHEPCPAGAYPEAPPTGRTPDCVAGPTGPAEAATANAPVGAPDPASLIEEQGLAGAYPTLIASGAGGKFGPDGNEPPDGPAGQWHGYSLARLLPDGDLVVEQRPILDWIGIDAADHALPPKSRLRLHGYGRSPISSGAESTWSACGGSCAYHYEIANAAITHRYDLLLANPEEPWLPCEESDVNCAELQANLSRAASDAPGAGEDAPSGGDSHSLAASGDSSESPCAPYLCLPSRIGTVDDQSGQVRAGDGRYPETFAIAMLSVDEKVATYPLVFKRSPAFVTRSQLRTPGAPPVNNVPTPKPPSQPQPPEPPQIPKVEIPEIPVPPGIPPLSATAPPEPQPPAPPAPPPPSQQPAALDLSVAPPGVSISTPTALIQPPTPPVNPAPPGGARREARQRQAAAQKGGAEGDGGEEKQFDDANSPNNAPGANYTRHDHPFTAYRPAADESSLGTGVLYAGGVSLLALAMALGWTHGRPTPRRRQPELPAPAFSRSRWRH